MDLKNIDPNSGNVVERNSKSNIEPANKVQIFFSTRDAFGAYKTSLFISFTSLIIME
jgi:hypothetical protein